MAKDIRDYLHLYLRCKVLTSKNEIATLVSVGTLGDHYQRFRILKEGFSLTQAMDGADKLILRPLSDITEEEKWEIISELPSPYNTLFDDLDFIQLQADQPNRCAPFLIYSLIPKLLSKSFDLFGLLDEGLATAQHKKI